jgi:pilus assembly protein CpaE
MIFDEPASHSEMIFPAASTEAEAVAPLPKGNNSKGRVKDILLVTRDGEVKQRVTEGFEGASGYTLRVLTGRAVEFEDEINNTVQPDLLLLDIHTATSLDMDALERLKHGRFRNTPLIVVSSYLDQSTVRILMQLKIEDWLPAEFTPPEVFRACERALRPKEEAKTSQDALCYAFLSANGGAGSTTLAIETAFHLGKSKGTLDTTCVVDLNLTDGVAADYLDVRPALDLAELAANPGRLDRQLVEVMVTRHSSGLSLLATPKQPGKVPEVGVGLLGTLLGVVSQSFSTVILDLPRTWTPWTSNVISGSDAIFLVCSFNVPALKQARGLAEAILSHTDTTTQVSVLVNKFHEPMFGSGLSRKDAEQVLGARLGGFIPDLGKAAVEAINRGVPLSDVASGNKLSKALAVLLSSAPQTDRRTVRVKR